MKRIAGKMAALALVLALAACGSADTGSPAAVASAPSGAQSGSAAPESITYWSLWTAGEPQAQVLAKAAAAFEEETGIHVEIQWKGREITELLEDALDRGETIDLFDDDLLRITGRFSSRCLDLEELAAEAGYEEFAVPVLTAAVRAWGGSLICIPYQPYTSGVFFTLGSFADAGLVDETGAAAIPSTWEEFLAVCEALKEAGYIPLAQDDGFVRYTYGYLIARLAGQQAVSALVRDGGWAQSEPALQAARYVETLRENGYLAPAGAEEYPAGENRLGEGSAAMVVNASWLPYEVMVNTGFWQDWGFFNFPDLGGSDHGTVANVGAQAMAVSRNSAAPRAAFAFILYATSGEWDRAMTQACNTIPADARNTEWPEPLACIREGFLAQDGVYEWNMGLNDNPAVADALRDNLLRLFRGTLDAQGFVRAMDAAYQTPQEEQGS